MRRAAAALLVVFAAGACTSILGEYTVVEGGGPPCDEETEREDCPDGLECDADYSGEGVCRRPCSESNPCPKWQVCSGRFCSEEVGTPCVDGFVDCGSGGTCITTDLDGADESRPYCSIGCEADDPEACPPGYACLESYCRDVD